MASSTARILVSRGRPTRNFAGMCGSISAHSSSVVSLAYRSPSRRYLMRVISVHDILGSPSLLTPRQNHKWLESLNSIFGQPLGKACSMAIARRPLHSLIRPEERIQHLDTGTTTETPDDLRRLAAEIVAAYVSANSVSAAQLPDVIRSVVDALTNLNGQAEAAKAEPQKPAVSIRKSVTPDYLVCLEDGKKLKMLKRHLRTTYDMSPQDYREKWGVPADCPIVAPNYAARRSEFAKQIGLGRKMIEEKKAKRSRVKKVRATSSEASPA